MAESRVRGWYLSRSIVFDFVGWLSKVRVGRSYPTLFPRVVVSALRRLGVLTVLPRVVGVFWNRSRVCSGRLLSCRGTFLTGTFLFGMLLEGKPRSEFVFTGRVVLLGRVVLMGRPAFTGRPVSTGLPVFTGLPASAGRPVFTGFPVVGVSDGRLSRPLPRSAVF